MLVKQSFGHSLFDMRSWAHILQTKPYAQVFQARASNRSDASPEAASTLSQAVAAATGVNSLAETQEVGCACDNNGLDTLNSDMTVLGTETADPST